MRAGPASAALACAGSVLGWAAARGAVARIERNPDPYPRHLLAADLEGEKVVIERPDGTRLRATSAGQGPPVAVAHGYAAGSREWNIVHDELIGLGYRVIAFDQRGHGRSTLGSDGIGSAQMAADYAALVEHFDVRDGVLVRHSMGGFVASRAVLDHQELAARLSGLVLFATWAGRLSDESPQNWLQIPLLRSVVLQGVTLSRTGGILFGAAGCGKRPSPAMISVFVERLNQHMKHHGALVPIVRAFVREDHYPRLAEISVPTVAKVGDADGTTPPVHSRRLAAAVPNAQLINVRDAGHVLNWEAGAKLVEVIESWFFRNHPERRGPRRIIRTK
jgi:non-heme chloroperoxidase